MSLRKLLLGPLLAILIATGVAKADDYPSRPIRLVLPWAAGGNTDGIARLMAERLSARINQQVVVENRPGANGLIGSNLVARAKPDGYTIMLALPETNVLNPLVYKNITYTAKDFDAVAFIGILPFTLVARANLEANTVSEVLALAKKAPNSVSAFSWGIGSTAHTAIALLEQAGNVRLLHVPYPGEAPALTQLIGGQGDLMFLSAERATTYASRREVKIIAATSSQRMKAYSDIPTFAEQGIPGFDVSLWYGIVAPAGTPAPIKDLLSKAVHEVLTEPMVLENLRKRGMVVQPESASWFDKFLGKETTRWATLIKAKNIHINN
ncbi:Bug family tripartite tricarboxylate transporter substrate binding protein [Cupriavidus sp. PET2-C1]